MSQDRPEWTQPPSLNTHSHTDLTNDDRCEAGHSRADHSTVSHIEPSHIEPSHIEPSHIEMKLSKERPSSPTRTPRCAPPPQERVELVTLEVPEESALDVDELKRDTRLIDLFHDERLVFPMRVIDTGPHMSRRKRLSFLKERDVQTLYERLYELSELSDDQDQAQDQGQERGRDQATRAALALLSEALELLVSLEEAGCPPLALSHEHVWVDRERGEVEVWLVARHKGSWPQAAAALITQCLLLFKEMSDAEMPSDDVLLEALDVLLGALSPRQVRALRRGLSGELTRCSELREALKADDVDDVDNADDVDDADEHRLTRGRQIERFERVVAQRVGEQKYHKRAHEFLSLEAQQEDRYFESVFRFEGELFWLGAVFDGVSTCSFGSGAEVAEAAKRALERGVQSIPRHRDRIVEVGNYAILDLMQRHIEQGVKELVEELAEREGVDPLNTQTPTSTMTLALIDSRGLALIKWSGDSPALVVSEGGEVVSLCLPHALKFEEQLLRESPLMDALTIEGGSQLTSDLSSLAFSTSTTVDHTQHQLKEGEALLLCSDGLIDGFKSAKKRLGGDARALNEIERWAQEHGTSDLYRLIHGVCHRADTHRGVDNITALGVRPRWSRSAQLSRTTEAPSVSEAREVRRSRDRSHRRRPSAGSRS